MEIDESDEKWAETIKELIKDRKISLRAFAQELGVSPTYLHKVINLEKHASPLLKVKIWELIDGDFTDRDFLIELIEKDAKEIVVNYIKNSEERVIDGLKKALKENDYAEMIKLLAKYRRWSIEIVGKDIGLDKEKIEKIIEGQESPSISKKMAIKGRVDYDIKNYTVMQKLPEVIARKVREFNSWNMRRLAEANRKKIAKDGN